MKKYDLIVIGGGAGGLTTASGAASMGAKVALINKGPLGGDCLWTGCVPTKSLIYSSKLVHYGQKSAMFGMAVTGRPEFSTARERFNKSISLIQKHDDPERFKALGIDIYFGYGSFDNAHEIRIDNEEVVYGKRIVIATGSHPFIPPIEGLKDAKYLTNETVFKLETQPKSLLIVGRGPIGLEFAQAFARFGTEVTVVERTSDILTKEDDELIPFVKTSLESDGVSLITGAEVKRVEEGMKKKVIVEKNGMTITYPVDQILIAVGRKANIQELHPENAAINIERGNIAVNNHLQTNVLHIYAIGDVNGLFPFTHGAGYEGKIAVANAVFGLKRKVDYSNIPWVTYTDPEVFHLGLTEKEARKKYGDIKVYKTELGEIDRFVCDHENQGIIKIITDRKGHILGAHAVGPGVGDFMQEVVFAKQYHHKIGDLSNVIHPYPTHVSGVQRTADLYWREKLFNGRLGKMLEAYIRWFR